MHHAHRVITPLFLAVVVFAAPLASAETLDQMLVQRGIVAAPDAAAAAAPAKAYWNKGTRIEFPNDGLTLQTNVYIQERYTFTDNSESAGKRNTSSFDTNKARLILSGSALHGMMDYYTASDFVGRKEADGLLSPTLLDAYVSWKPLPGAAFRLGQWKTGLSRQYMSADQYAQFPDRSVANNYFNLGRQAGGMATYTGDRYLLNAALFNGQSTGEGLDRSGIDTRHTAVFNARGDVLGKMNPLEEGDIETTPGPALNVGAAYAYADAALAADTGLNAVSREIVDVDANFKYQGFSIHAEGYREHSSPDIGEPAQPFGWYVQSGWFVLPSRLELVARYSALDCDNGAAGGLCVGQDRISQQTAGVTYYFWKHFTKVTLLVEHESSHGVSGTDVSIDRVLTQVSLFL